MSEILSGALAGARRCLHYLIAFIASVSVTTAAGQLTVDDAERARMAPLVTESLFLDGAAVADHMVVVGERGHILVSRDAGLTWTQADVPTRSTLTGITLIDSTRGWAVGHDATILRTRDGGLSWQRVYAAPEDERPLLDVWFENADHGFAVGAYGLFLETHDGGDTWQSRDIDASDTHLNQITAASSQRLYIAGEAGTVYRSDDGGRSWKRLITPYNGSFFGTLPLDERRLYLFGLRGHLFYSADAGTTWRTLDTRTSSLLTDGILIDRNSVVITGMDGTLLAVADGGDSIRPLQRVNRSGIAGALDAGDGVLVVFGEAGVERIIPRRLESVK